MSTIPLDIEAPRGCEGGGQSLLTIEHVMDVVALWSGRQFDTPKNAHGSEFLFCPPEDEGT